MKIVVYSDLHAHPFKNGVVTEHGRNSRVDDALGVITQVYDHAESLLAEQDYTVVLFGGDLFDRRKSIDVDTFNGVHNLITKRSSGAIFTYMIPGNHDQANRSGTIHALQRFNNENCVSFHAPTWRCLDGGNTFMFAVPYYDDGEVIAAHIAEGLQNRPAEATNAFLLMHYGVQGAKVGPSDYVLPCELSLPMLQVDQWDLILSGHYHIGQQLGSKFHYIGSAMQHRWDDAGFDKSLLELDTRTWSVSRVPLLAPKFVVITDDPKSQNVKNCFVRVLKSYEIEDAEKRALVSDLRERGAISVEFRVTPPEKEDHSERIVFSEEGGSVSILENYLDSEIIDLGGLDRDRLLGIGKDLVQEIQSA